MIMSEHETEPGRPVTVIEEADGTATQATELDPLTTPAAAPGSLKKIVKFAMVRSAAAIAAGCIPKAAGAVTITRGALNDVMTVSVSGLPPNTDFDLFLLELPDAPFGVAWYQSDLHTDATGSGTVTVQGIFNKETFSLSLGDPGGENPLVGLNGPAVKDTNVVFRPTHLYHLGLWFNKPADAGGACKNTTVTPFNGTQTAGIQALSTRSFPASDGPLEI
jgi:hypothetical protein